MSSSNTKSIDLYAPLPFQTPSFSEPDFIRNHVKSHLTQKNDPSAVYANRVAGRYILLENPVKESRIKKLREEKEKRRKDEKRKALRKLGGREARAFSLDPAQAKFHLFIPLHHLWLGYISELLNLGSKDKKNIPSGTMHPKLVKADFHGSIIMVRRSKNLSLVGLSGIMVYETENAFRIVDRRDKIKLLPKAGTVFTFSVPAYSFTSPPSFSTSDPSLHQEPSSPSPQSRLTVEDIPHLEFELYGNQFLFRSSERATRKFKAKQTIEL